MTPRQTARLRSVEDALEREVGGRVGRRVLLGGVVVDVLAAAQVVRPGHLDRGPAVGQVALHPRLGARPAHRRGDPVEARVTAHRRAVRAELARLGVVVLDRHVLEVRAVGDLELDDHVQVAGHRRGELLGERGARAPLDARPARGGRAPSPRRSARAPRGAAPRRATPAGTCSSTPSVQRAAFPAENFSSPGTTEPRCGSTSSGRSAIDPGEAAERDAAGRVALDREHPRVRRRTRPGRSRGGS